MTPDEIQKDREAGTPMTSEAGVYTARGIHELGMMVASLAGEGYRIIAVIDTQNGDYHVVAQKDGSAP